MTVWNRHSSPESRRTPRTPAQDFERSPPCARDADIEHLLLALTLDADLGGQVLRSAGVTLDRVRWAIDEERAAQLASLGLTVQHDADRIVFHETSGYDWTPQALTVLNKSNSRGRDGSSIAVLRTLLDEPSGTIAAILAHLEVDREEIAQRLDHAEGLASAESASSDAAAYLRKSVETFVPASPASVEAFLSDPDRIAEWEPSLESVSSDGAQWEGRTRTTKGDGTPYDVKSEVRRQLIERVESPTDIAWRFRYPDAVRSNTRVVSFRCEPAAGGTHLHISLAWERSPDRAPRRILGFVLRPVFRLLLFTQITQISSGVTRAFR